MTIKSNAKINRLEIQSLTGGTETNLCRLHYHGGKEITFLFGLVFGRQFFCKVYTTH